MTTTFRAAYWISADKQASVRLTPEKLQALRDDDLLSVASLEAQEIGLVREPGDDILVGDWTE